MLQMGREYRRGGKMRSDEGPAVARTSDLSSKVTGISLKMKDLIYHSFMTQTGAGVWARSRTRGASKDLKPQKNMHEG